MKQTFHVVAELEYFDGKSINVRTDIIAKIDEFDSHVSAMNYLDSLISAKMEDLRKFGYDPVIKDRYAKLWKY